jgi:hypothetical protein
MIHIIYLVQGTALAVLLPTIDPTTLPPKETAKYITVPRHMNKHIAIAICFLNSGPQS